MINIHDGSSVAKFSLTDEVERFSETEFGFTCLVKTNEGLRIKNNVTEIHANHSEGGSIAFESDIHGTGINMDIESYGIKSVSVHVADKFSDEFDSHYCANSSIKNRVTALRTLLAVNSSWAIRGLIAIYNLQTEDEKLAETTSHDNGVGFTGVDSEILSSFAKQVLAKRFAASPKQMKILHKKMPKYAKQLDKVAQGII